jgi:hypothetical protein
MRAQIVARRFIFVSLLFLQRTKRFAFSLKVLGLVRMTIRETLAFRTFERERRTFPVSFPKIRSGRIRAVKEKSDHHPMRSLRSSIYLEHLSPICSSRGAGLKLRILFLRHQLNIILRRPPQRLRLQGSDRALMVWMTRLWPSLLASARVVQPATILRWHRAGFRTYWRWKSQDRPGRPRIEHRTLWKRPVWHTILDE